MRMVSMVLPHLSPSSASPFPTLPPRVELRFTVFFGFVLRSTVLRSTSLLIIDLMERREWLTEIWKQHHQDETNRFSRCNKCPCRSLSRVQRLWSTGTTRRDYIS